MWINLVLCATWHRAGAHPVVIFLFSLSVLIAVVFSVRLLFSQCQLCFLSLLSYKKRHLNLCKHQRFMGSFVCLDWITWWRSRLSWNHLGNRGPIGKIFKMFTLRQNQVFFQVKRVCPLQLWFCNWARKTLPSSSGVKEELGDNPTFFLVWPH